MLINLPLNHESNVSANQVPTLDNVQDFGATAQKVVVHTRVLMTKPLEDRDSEGCAHGR